MVDSVEAVVVLEAVAPQEGGNPNPDISGCLLSRSGGITADYPATINYNESKAFIIKAG